MVNKDIISKIFTNVILNKCASATIRRIGSRYTVSTATLPKINMGKIVGEEKQRKITYENGISVSFIEEDYYGEKNFNLDSITIDGETLRIID